MIKNVIFDFGNVLTQYDPVAWAADVMNKDFKKGKYLHDKTIDNKKIWEDYDAGLCTEVEVIDRLRADIEPEYRDAVMEYVKTVEQCFSQYDEMIPVIQKLKDNGCRTFLLSNFPLEMFVKVAARCPILDMLDAQIVSYKIHLTKPHADIFEYVLNTYGLKADECLFTDDNATNTDACEKVGIHGYTFTTAEKFEKHLKELQVI